MGLYVAAVCMYPAYSVYSPHPRTVPSVVCIPVWRGRVFQCGVYSSVAWACIPVWRVFHCGVYSSVACIPVWRGRVFQSGVYSSVACIPLWRVFHCGVYSSVACIPVCIWRVFQCGVYSSIVCIPSGIGLLYPVWCVFPVMGLRDCCTQYGVYSQ